MKAYMTSFFRIGQCLIWLPGVPGLTSRLAFPVTFASTLDTERWPSKSTDSFDNWLLFIIYYISTISYYAILYYIILYYIMLYYIILCYIIVYYIILYCSEIRQWTDNIQPSHPEPARFHHPRESDQLCRFHLLPPAIRLPELQGREAIMSNIPWSKEDWNYLFFLAPGVSALGSVVPQAVASSCWREFPSY